MSDIKKKIETILITEVNKLYEKASTPLGLSVEDIRKLEILVKIKEVEKNDKQLSDEPTAKVRDLKDLWKIAEDTLKDGK